MTGLRIRRLALDFGLVQGHGGANESLQPLSSIFLALVEVGGAPTPRAGWRFVEVNAYYEC
jgi:hypothetical protein